MWMNYEYLEDWLVNFPPGNCMGCKVLALVFPVYKVGMTGSMWRSNSMKPKHGCGMIFFFFAFLLL